MSFFLEHLPGGIYNRIFFHMPSFPCKGRPNKGEKLNTKTNLPLELSSLLGRNTELSEIRQFLGEQRLVTLSGPGGTGKTRIARKVAWSLLDTFEHGVWFIDLTGIFQNSGVAGAAARVLGFLEEDQVALPDTIAHQLEGRNILLVLDNCEQVLPGCAEFVKKVLAQAPEAKVLTTTREPLRISGEFVRRVLPLSMDDGTKLFRARAQQATSDFTSRTTSDAIVHEIVGRLDGIPLAIELAAARTSMLAPEQILAGLDKRFNLLTSGVRDAIPHHKSLWASVAWSYNLMTPSEQALARRLCVLRGLTLETASAIGAIDLPAETSVLDQLQRLVDMSIVQVDRSGKEPRYRFLETVREFFLEKLQEAGETTAARAAHLSHFIEFAEYRAQRLILGDGPELLLQIQTEFDNLEDALVFAESCDDPSQLFKLLIALTGYYELWGQYQHGMRWFEKALAKESASKVLMARALWGSAHVSAYGGRGDIAFPRAEQARQMAQEIGDIWTEARALDLVGFAQSISDPVAAHKSLTRCIELGAKLGDSWAENHGIKMITTVYLFSHDAVGGSAAIENLLSIAEKHSSRYLQAWANAVKGYFARDCGDLDAAEAALSNSIENASYVGDPATGGFAKVWSSALKADRGQVDEARQEMLDLMQSASVTGTFLAVPETMFQLGMLEVSEGNPDVTLQIIGGHVEELKSAGIIVWAAQLAVASAAALIATKHFEEAKSHLKDAEEMSASLNNPLINGLICYLRGRHAMARGDIGEAEAHLHEALEIQQSAGLLPRLLRTMASIAAILAEKEKLEDAARVLMFIDQTYTKMQLVRGKTEEAEFLELKSHLYKALGQENLSDFEKSTAKSDLEEIVGLISRMRGKRARPLTGWDSLTPTERRVVTLATEGLSNPEIAERMFIVRGTVKVHLSHIYEKLDVKSRTQLAAKSVADEFEANPGD